MAAATDKCRRNSPYPLQPYTLAMMAAGTDETSRPKPGFPEHWKVKVEALHKMP